MKKALFETKVLPINEILTAGYNPRKDLQPSDIEYQELRKSIETFGYVEGIIFNQRTKTLVGGHQRLKVLKELGYTHVQVTVIDVDIIHEKTLNIGLNKIHGDWDDLKLAELLQEIQSKDIDFMLTGFELSEVDLLLKDISIDVNKVLVTDHDDFDISDEYKSISEPQIKKGDLISLGRHYLLCGDSTDAEDVKKLMGNKKAHMIFTDPPYNVKVSDIVGLGKIKHDEFKMASGEMSQEEFINFLKKIFANLIEFSIDGSIHYICMDWKHIYELLIAAKDQYSELKNLCVWNKDNGGMGTFYRSKHELVFVFKNGKAKHINNFELGQHGRYRTNVWDYSGVNSLSNKNRMDELGLHPTVKPISLVADAIKDCSHPSHIILDLFGGSGTTLIAAEETQRVAYLCELDPRYCEVIIKRWEAHTGQKALLMDGKNVTALA